MPAIRFIFLLFLVKKPIIWLLLVLDTIDNASKGKAIPIPNIIKLRKFSKKLAVDVLKANKTISEAGLQGKTIAPKKNPKIKELK